MKILNLVQGSPEWHAARAEHFTASEAPAMAGVSKYTSRNDLLKQKKTGITPEVSEHQQRIFDRGHAAEASARPIAERIIGEELFPCTAVSDEHPELLASYDGITMLEDVCWEHKLINDELRQATAETLAEHYKVQMDQQMLVSGAEKCLFMASDGTEDDCNHFWYYRDEERIQRLIAGWEQFKTDLEAYEPHPEQVAATGKAPGSLPALVVELTGAVRNSNLEEFKQVALARIASISTELVTDEDFATAEKTIKFLNKAEKDLDTAKAAALQQTASISELFNTIDQLKAEMRDKRLELNKLVKAEKENRKAQIIERAEKAFTDWLNQQNSPAPVDVHFAPALAMKGKKTIATLQSAADDALAAAKIEAKRQIDLFVSNKELLNSKAEGYEFLFSDHQALIRKEPGDLEAIITARIAEHEQREAERLKQEKERIRREEEAKAKAEAERKMREEQAKARQEITKSAPESERTEDQAELPLQPSNTPTALHPHELVDVAAEDTVTISRSEYEQLLADQAKLLALEAAGVDSWDGYSVAMEALSAA